MQKFLSATFAISKQSHLSFTVCVPANGRKNLGTIFHLCTEFEFKTFLKMNYIQVLTELALTQFFGKGCLTTFANTYFKCTFASKLIREKYQ